VTATHPPVGARRDSATSVFDRGMSPVIVAEVGLTLVTLAAIAGFVRLYRDTSFFVPLAVLAVCAHAVAALCRRRRLAPPLIALIAVAVGAVLIVWLLFGRTTVLGIPTFHTFHAANAELHRAWGRFGVVIAPAPVFPGFQLAAAVAVWAGVWFSDWSAFRLWASAESLAPATVLFVFTSLLGAPRHRGWTTVLFAGAAMAFMLVHRMARQEGASTWVATAPGAGRRSLVRAGGALGAVAILGGAALGPQVPGARDEAILSWRQGPAGTGSRITVSPLVDIRKRLVQQSNKEAFNVRSNRPAYWRLTSLDTFDGRIWSSGGSFSQAQGSLPNTAGSSPDRRVEQEFEIGALDAIWAPAAFEASSVDPGDSRMRWDADSATLIVDDDRTTSDGLIYRVVSEAPQLTGGMLRRASTPVPDEIGRTYLGLPGDFNREAALLARKVTRAGRTPYDRALLLQNWFRDRFTYDVSVPAGHSEDAIAEFLSTRRGYCEQFAGTYAAMARSIGLPSRVGVGFTPGDTDPSDPDLYHVKGKHAHAWPEVWLGDVGWVPFEPTPGRGAPGAEPYTGVRPQQAASARLNGTGTTAPETTPSSSTPAGANRLNPERFNINAGNGSAGRGGKHRATDNPFVMAPLALLLAGLSYLGLTFLVPRLRRRRARARAISAQERVTLAWDEAAMAVAANRATLPFSSETHHEYASRVAPVLGPAAGAHQELASLASAATWSDTGPAEPSVARAEALSRSIEHQVGQRLTGRDRVRNRLNPQRLVPARPPTRPPHQTKPSKQPAGRT